VSSPASPNVSSIELDFLARRAGLRPDDGRSSYTDIERLTKLGAITFTRPDVPDRRSDVRLLTNHRLSAPVDPRLLDRPAVSAGAMSDGLGAGAGTW
jgi:hypothetical protein